MMKEEGLNESTRVLIISDRLVECAKALSNFLITAGIYVVGVVENKQQVLKTTESQSFDYLIIAGYLNDTKNYEVIEELRHQYKTFIPIQWAILDSLITSYCFQYRIPLKFDRTLPLNDFVLFLQEHKDDKWGYMQGFSDELSYRGYNGDEESLEKKNYSSFFRRFKQYLTSK